MSSSDDGSDWTDDNDTPMDTETTAPPPAPEPEAPSAYPKKGYKFENVLKKRKSLEIMDAHRQIKAEKKHAQKLKRKKAREVAKDPKFVRPEVFIMRERKKQKNLVRARRVDKNPALTAFDRRTLQKHKSHLQEEQQHLALIIRIRGNNGLTPRITKLLSYWKLTGKNRAVLLPVNEKMMRDLKVAQSYITWGFPSKQAVNDLLYKRGVTAVGRKPLTDNTVIEEALGETTGIICIEDLVHELYNYGPNFLSVCQFLAAFKLETPAGGFRNKRVPFSRGGDSGLRGEKINDLLTRMI